MDLKPLSEVDLREAIGPINRAVTGHYLPSVRTASGLRERAALGLLDMKLSRCAFIGRDLVGACLVERVDERAHLDAIGVDPLAQQRGVGHAILESACVAAEATGVRRFTAEVPESDAASLATLQSAGFQPGRGIGRWALASEAQPADLPLPDVVTGGGQTQGQVFVRKVELGEALSFLYPADMATDDRPFSQQPEVLRRLASKLCALLMLQVEPHDPILGAVIIERDRHQLLALGGQVDRLAPLVTLLLRRYGVTHADAIPEGDPMTPALVGSGMSRLALRQELLRILP